MLATRAVRLFATAFGTLAAIGMQRVGRRMRTAFETMVYGTIVTPEIVIAIASLLFFVTIIALVLIRRIRET